MNKKSTQEISLKNTKEQILSAYQEALLKLEAKQVSEPLSEKRKAQETETVSKASQHKAETIVADLAGLKINLIKQVDTLSESLVAEFNKLSEMRSAIMIEQKHLQELYGINETAKTLSALILSQQEQKEQFAQEMLDEKNAFEEDITAKKANWKQQEESLNAAYKELKEQTEKARKREEEEYKYNVELKRRKELDVYAEQKSALAKELEKLRQEWNDREAALKAKEQEFTELHQKVENFPIELAKTKEHAENTLSAQLETQHQYANNLLAKEIEGERKLSEQKIIALEKKIKEQDQLVAQLTQKADAATNQIQAIACRALDTSAQRFNIPAYQEDKPARVSDK